MLNISLKIRAIICENEQYYGSISDSAKNNQSDNTKANSSIDIQDITRTFLIATQKIYSFKLMTQKFLESSIKRSIHEEIIKNRKNSNEIIDYAEVLKGICKNKGIDLYYISSFMFENVNQYELFKSINYHKRPVGRMALVSNKYTINDLLVPEPVNIIFTYCEHWGANLDLYVDKQIWEPFSRPELTVFDILKQIYITIYSNKVKIFYQTKKIDMLFLQYIDEAFKQEHEFTELGKVKHTEDDFLQKLAYAIDLNMLHTEISTYYYYWSKLLVDLDVHQYVNIDSVIFKDLKTPAHSSALFLQQSLYFSFGDQSNGYFPMSIYNSMLDPEEENQTNQENNDNPPKKQKPNLQYLVWLAEKDMNGFTRHCRFFPIDKRYRQDTKSLCLLVYCENEILQKKDLELLKNALDIVSSDVDRKTGTPEMYDNSITVINNFEEKRLLVQSLVDRGISGSFNVSLPWKDLNDKLLMAIPFINEFFNAQTNDDQIINLFEQHVALDPIVQCIRKIYNWKKFVSME